MSHADTESPEAVLRRQIVDAALDLAAREGWRELSLGALARAAGRPLSDIYRHIRSKTDILRLLSERLDLAMLEEPTSPGDQPRDQLFDVCMLRFEAMEPYKPALRVIAYDIRRDPVTLAALAPALRRSLAWMLEAAGISADGLAGAGRVRALGFILSRTFWIWLEEDGSDMAKTMADLDRRLRNAERWLIPGASRRGRPDPKAASKAPEAGHVNGHDNGASAS